MNRQPERLEKAKVQYLGALPKFRSTSVLTALLQLFYLLAPSGGLYVTALYTLARSLSVTKNLLEPKAGDKHHRQHANRHMNERQRITSLMNTINMHINTSPCYYCLGSWWIIRCRIMIQRQRPPGHRTWKAAPWRKRELFDFSVLPSNRLRKSLKCLSCSRPYILIVVAYILVFNA
jgi:hypothetical protein